MPVIFRRWRFDLPTGAVPIALPIRAEAPPIPWAWDGDASVSEGFFSISRSSSAEAAIVGVTDCECISRKRSASRSSVPAKFEGQEANNRRKVIFTNWRLPMLRQCRLSRCRNSSMRAYKRRSAAFSLKLCVAAMRLTKWTPESLRRFRIRIWLHVSD